MNNVWLTAVCPGIALLASCSTINEQASPQVLDSEAVVGEPKYEPMLIVPMPKLTPGRRSQRPVEALQARNTPVGDVLLALFKDSDLNLLVDASVQSMDCTFDIKRSTVEETFAAVLRSLDLGYVWDGNYLHIVDRMQETVHVDLMDSEVASASGQSGTGNQSSGNSSGGGTGEGTNFWDVVENGLPKILGEDSTFVINRAASTIHVQARPSGIQRLRELVDTTVRRANRQVSLEARLLEVRLRDEHSLGVNWALLPGMFNTGNTGLGAGGAVVSQVAASGGSALNFGVLDTNQFSVFVDALQQQGQVRVLSSPRVSTMNNQMASIAITDQIPYITREVIDDQGVARTEYGVEFVDAGVTLQVRPMIGEDGLLTVAVTPQVREQTGTVVTPDGLISVPVMSQRQATTLVRVSNGQAIALGGLRSTRKDETRSGVPFLMNIPMLGQLFSSTVQSRTEVELMIVLVPRVLDDSWIAEEVRRGAHRLIELRRDFQWNSIQLESYRTEDWSGGSLQGDAQSAPSPSVRIEESAPKAAPAEAGLTVTRRGLADHLLARAQDSLDSGDVAAATDAVDRALALDPSNSVALVAAAVLHHRGGNMVKARNCLDRALAVSGDDVLALTVRGIVELDQGGPHSARRYLQRAHSLSPSALTAVALSGALLALGEHQAVCELLVPMANDNAPAELHANLAFAQWSHGAADAARASLQRAMVAGADPRNPRVVALQRMLAVRTDEPKR